MRHSTWEENDGDDMRRNDEDFNMHQHWRQDDYPAEVQQPSIMQLLYQLTDSERLAVFKHFCKHCGSKDPLCKCKENGEDKTIS